MFGDCPHTHTPVPHQAEFDDNGPAVQACGTCSGLLIQCGGCDTLNRRAATYCRYCKRKLDNHAAKQRLAKPGELMRRIEDAVQAPLSEVFPAPDDAIPVHWLVGEDGLYLFSEQAYLGQCNVYRAPLTDFPTPAGAMLTRYPLPATDRWIDEPFLGRHGLFLATADALHYFPTHGDADYLVQRTWTAPPGRKIAALCRRDNEHCCLLVVDADSATPSNGVIVYDGNTQTGDWKPSISLDLPAAQGYGYVAGPAGSAFDADIWVYNGAEVVFVSLGRAPLVRKRLQLEQGQEPLRSVKERSRRGFFAPFMMTNGVGLRQFVFPGKPHNDALASINVLDLANDRVRSWGDLGREDWLRADPWGEGVLVRRRGKLLHLVNGTALTEKEEIGRAHV